MAVPKESLINGYSLTHGWFDFVLENPDKVTGNHTALYLWLVQINNRCQWREKFQITAKELMDGMSCKSRSTYTKCFHDLVEWEFVQIVTKSTNQYQCNVISLYNNYTTIRQPQDNHKSTTSTITGHIPKQLNNETLKTINIEFDVFWDLYDNKQDRKACEPKWVNLTNKERVDIIEYIPKYIESQPDKQFRKHPKTFLNNRSWENEIISNVSTMADTEKPKELTAIERRNLKIKENENV